ncbi:hypothetical protein Tco_0212330 [Tanacetum coccineum]
MDQIRNLDAQINIMKVLNVGSTEGVKPTSGASKPVPKRDPQNHSSLPAKRVHARRVEAHHRTLNKKNRVDSHLLVKHSVSVSNLNNVPKGSLAVQIVLWYLDSGCSRHMTGDRARLINFVEKFIGTVRFGNDEYVAIVGYGDYKLGDTIISRVYYVEDSRHNTIITVDSFVYEVNVPAARHSRHANGVPFHNSFHRTALLQLLKALASLKYLYKTLVTYDVETTVRFMLHQYRVIPTTNYLRAKVDSKHNPHCKHYWDKTVLSLLEVTEYMRIFDELDTEYERCVLANKNLKIERKNLLIQNDCLIANSLEKDICSIVLASDIVVPPSSNCLCEELRSNCDREHSKVVELEAEILKKQQMLNESEKRCAFIEKNHVNLQVKFQKYKECLQNQRVCDNSNSTASNAIFEINKLKDQLQGKDDTIRNLQTQINITRMLNVGSTVGSFDKQALETELTQLKDALTSVRIQIDGYKAENVNLKRRYEELSKSNAYSRSTFTAKINALTAENAKLKTELSGKKSSGSTASEKPKVLASGMYTNSSKYVPPPKRANWVKPTPLPKKKQVTFQEPPRTSNRPTQKPPVQQNKKPNVFVNLSTRTRLAIESRKPMPKSHTWNHRILPSKSVNARRAADHNRKLNVVDHNQFVIPWRPTRKVVGSVKPQWKPTGRHFALYDNCPLTRIMEPIVEPLELTPSVSSSSKVTMISRSKGRPVADSIAERLTRPTAYKFKTDCSIIPV